MHLGLNSTKTISNSTLGHSRKLNKAECDISSGQNKTVLCVKSYI